MATTTLRRLRPAGAATPAADARRVSWAQLVLGLLGTASSLFVVLRLTETWHVSANAASHHVSVLGQRLSYPAANLGALFVLVLAGAGLAALATAAVAVVRALIASAKLGRRLRAVATEGEAGAMVVPGTAPRAFCHGLLWPRVYLSAGALAGLDGSALAAVLAHEHHHLARRDPLRLAAGRILARAFFFLPALGALAADQEILAELGADASAIAVASGGRAGLARAMVVFEDGIAPERVDQLLGHATGRRIPVLVCLASGAVLALAAALAVLAGQVARGSATLSPPFLSSRPCIVVLAMIPAVAGAFVLRARLRSRLAP
jgi:Zn-dependent protease with chaperone function